MRRVFGLYWHFYCLLEQIEGVTPSSVDAIFQRRNQESIDFYLNKCSGNRREPRSRPEGFDIMRPSTWMKPFLVLSLSQDFSVTLCVAAADPLNGADVIIRHEMLHPAIRTNYAHMCSYFFLLVFFCFFCFRPATFTSNRLPLPKQQHMHIHPCKGCFPARFSILFG